MAWSFADVSANEIAWAALDYPMLIAQTIPISPSYCKWVDQAQFVGAGNITTWTDRSAAATPARRGYDGLPGLITERGTTDDDIYYYCIDCGTEVTFDCAFVIGHNCGTLDLVNNLVLQIADNNGFDTSLTTVADFGDPSDDTRLADLSLSHAADAGRAHDVGADAGPNRYTSRYICLKYDKTGTNITPELGELVLGRRYQMRLNPKNPWDRDALHDEATYAKTAGGVTYSTRFFSNQHILSVTFNAWETARIADFKTWFTAAHGPFVWLPQPNSAPDSWYLMVKPTDLSMPSSEYTERTVTISAEEQGPEEFFLQNE